MCEGFRNFTVLDMILNLYTFFSFYILPFLRQPLIKKRFYNSMIGSTVLVNKLKQISHIFPNFAFQLLSLYLLHTV